MIGPMISSTWQALMTPSTASLKCVAMRSELAAAHMTGARNIPLSQLEEKLPAAVKNKTLPLILVCASGARANRALPAVKKLGYDQAQVLAGGLKGWKEANLPLEKA